MKFSVLLSVLMLSTAISVQAQSRGEGPGNLRGNSRNQQARASFSFSIGDGETSLNNLQSLSNRRFSGYVFQKEPLQNSYCIKQSRGIEIGDGKKQISSIIVSNSETTNLRVVEVGAYSKETSSAMAVVTSPGSYGGNIQKYCSVLGLAEDQVNKKTALIHHWVNIETHVPLNSNVSFAPIADFGPILRMVTIGISDLIQNTTQAVSSALEASINEQIRKANGDKIAVYNAIATELMLMMCEVQAAKLADEACPGAKVESEKYIRQVRERYENFTAAH